MSYLLIAFIIVVVLSPLAWLKTSPAQARITAFRRRALELGLQVQLVPQADAEASDKRPSAVRYFLAFRPANGQGQSLGTWTLLRSERRGWPSPWPEWRWFRGEAPKYLTATLDDLMASMPDIVCAIRMEEQGAALYLKESGAIAVVDELAMVLKSLLSKPI